MRLWQLLVAAVGLVAVSEPVRGDDKVDFNREVRPILSDKCFACHGPGLKRAKGGLRLDLPESAREVDGDGLGAISPGKPEKSAVIERIYSHDEAKVMPPPSSNKHLTAAEKAILKRWIAEGAEYKKHWAFIAPARPGVPQVKAKSWPANPIDFFILQRLEQEGLKPNPRAAKTMLIRRVTLDLTGLPPTPEEVDAFLKDTSADAYARVVDRLMTSPRYGEHMARFWLDAARYGDTHGMHLDNYREIWPYREWVIKAFNTNMPFNRFVVEQLAGDLLPNAADDQLVATGFLRCHVTTNEGGSIEEEVFVRNVIDRVDTNGTVFLGMTVGCARCHDHKYDPLNMKDYYQVFAFFNNLDGRAMDGNQPQHPPTLKLATPEEKQILARLDQQITELKGRLSKETARYLKDDSLRPEEEKWLKTVRNNPKANVPDAIKQILKTDPKKWNKQQKDQVREHFIIYVNDKTRGDFAELTKQLTPLQKQFTDLDKKIPTTLIFKELSTPRPAFLLKRGEYDKKLDQVGRDTPAFLPPLPPGAPRNRLGFAQWLTDPKHPLTARVAVNRLWQQFLGTGLVKTAEDFGLQGEPPSHPELLDWLAVQFVDDGWDVKKFVKRIVMSATYQQSGKVTKERLAKDPGNRLLCNGPRFRLDAEMLRDQALFISGLLVEKVGGPSVKPPQPSGLWEAVAFTGSNTGKFAADTGHDKVHRRSMYIFWKRTASPPQMNAFDAPSREACVVRRERTNTPLQALLLMNEVQFVEAARMFAERTLKQGGATPEARLVYMFRWATARTPDARELAELKAILVDYRATYSGNEKAAQQLINVGETRPDASLDARELAAWTMLANLILNLDEVITRG